MLAKTPASARTLWHRSKATVDQQGHKDIVNLASGHQSPAASTNSVIKSAQGQLQQWSVKGNERIQYGYQELGHDGAFA
jgi:hypothetical protein